MGDICKKEEMEEEEGEEEEEERRRWRGIAGDGRGGKLHRNVLRTGFCIVDW